MELNEHAHTETHALSVPHSNNRLRHSCATLVYLCQSKVPSCVMASSMLLLVLGCVGLLLRPWHLNDVVTMHRNTCTVPHSNNRLRHSCATLAHMHMHTHMSS